MPTRRPIGIVDSLAMSLTVLCGFVSSILNKMVSFSLLSVVESVRTQVSKIRPLVDGM